MLNDLNATYNATQLQCAALPKIGLRLSPQFVEAYSEYVRTSPSVSGGFVNVEFDLGSAILTSSPTGNSDSVLTCVSTYGFAVAHRLTPLMRDLDEYKSRVKQIFQSKPKADSDALIKDLRQSSPPANALVELDHALAALPQDEQPLVRKFLTDYSWWHGEKGIERNDFMYSPLLTCAKLVAVSNGAIPTITRHFFDSRSLYDSFGYYTANIAQPSPATPYTKQDFLSEVFLDDIEYDKLVSLLTLKKNLVLQGAPGVGKTFAAKRLAWSILGSRNDSHISFVQFHQSYCYEDFVMGFKPDAAGFSVALGVFFNACKNALSAPEEKFFVIIDEINRGNLSRIFGELLMLIESDKRGSSTGHKFSVHLPNASSLSDAADSAYANDFYVPDNLYIIGMMNTADRSLAIIDYALRRRFAFYEMSPAFDSPGFKSIMPDPATEPQGKYNSFLQCLRNLNTELATEFGTGFRIGHSYFCKQGLTKTQLENIVNYEIYPLLQEYWFDDTSMPKRKYEVWRDSLLAAL